MSYEGPRPKYSPVEYWVTGRYLHSKSRLRKPISSLKTGSVTIRPIGVEYSISHHVIPVV